MKISRIIKKVKLSLSYLTGSPVQVHSFVDEYGKDDFECVYTQEWGYSSLWEVRMGLNAVWSPYSGKYTYDSVCTSRVDGLQGILHRLSSRAKKRLASLRGKDVRFFGGRR